MLIVQFPTIIFGPSLKQVKYWDTNTKNKVKEWEWLIVQAQFFFQSWYYGFNWKDDGMVKLNKWSIIRQHTDRCMWKRPKSERKIWDIGSENVCKQMMN